MSRISVPQPLNYALALEPSVNASVYLPIPVLRIRDIGRALGSENS